MNDLDGLIANFYELWGAIDLGAFSNDMYQNSFYFPVMIGLFGVLVLFFVIYYLALDRPKFAKIYWWFIFIILLPGVINYFIAYLTASNRLGQMYAQAGQMMPDYSMDIMIFSFINTGYSVVIGFIVSLIVKMFTVSLKKIPF